MIKIQDRHGPRYRDCPSTPRIAVFLAGPDSVTQNKVIFIHHHPNNQTTTPKGVLNRPPRVPPSTTPFFCHLRVLNDVKLLHKHPANRLFAAAAAPRPRVSEISRCNAESTLLLHHIVQLDLQRQHPVLPAQRVPSA